MARVLVISLSDLGGDSRVDRQIGFLRSRHEVIAAGLGPPAYDDVAFIDLTRRARPRAIEVALRGLSAGQILARQYDVAYWRHPANRDALARLERHGADVVIANDVSALPLAVRAANGASVIFDAHEYAPAEHSHIRWWRLIMSPYVDGLLRCYLPRVAAMTTVAPMLAERYASRYGIHAEVLTNASARAALDPTPVHKPIRLIHHGIAYPQRQIELMIQAIDLLGERFTLDLMLMPSNRVYVEKLERMASARSQVRFVEPVSQREIVSFCNAYDIGMCTLPPANENVEHALPNKLFEFIQARLAVVVGPSPEMARLVREWGCGVIADGFRPEDLAAALATMTNERIEAFKRSSDRAADHLSSDRNREIMLDLVDRVLATSATPV